MWCLQQIKADLVRHSYAINIMKMSNEVEDNVIGAEYMPYEPVWFKNEMEPVTGQLSHIYKGGYWDCKEKQDWSMCPHIF